jgi:hypothetical protein
MSLDQNEDERHKHPSFGQIGFSRINSTGTNFYGSELKQDNYIQMKVYQSEIQRDLSCDRYFASNHTPIIQIRMSSNQFAEMITSMNRGDGIPCTIEAFDRKMVEHLPEQESRKEFIHRKFDDRMREFAKTLKVKQARVKDLSAKKTLSKADQQELNFTVEWLTQEVASNIPFFAKCFQETMDIVVNEAKSEIENAIQHKINVLGLEGLHEQNKLLKS